MVDQNTIRALQVNHVNREVLEFMALVSCIHLELSAKADKKKVPSPFHVRRAYLSII